MGIVDEDTRKIFETALTSKNIDLNPPLRRLFFNNIGISVRWYNTKDRGALTGIQVKAVQVRESEMPIIAKINMRIKLKNRNNVTNSR